MIKNICNTELVVPQKSKKSKLALAIVLGVALLPFSAIAEPINDKEIIKSPAKMTIEEVDNIPSSENSKGVTVLDNESIKPKAVEQSNDTNSDTLATNIEIPDASTVNTTEASNISDKNVINNGTSNSSNNAAASTAAFDNIGGLNPDNTEEKPIGKPPETAKKVPFWKNTNYLLGGGLTLLILGGALLSFLKISRLGDENRELTQKYKMLKGEKSSVVSKLKQSNADNERLKADLKNQLDIRDGQNNISSEAFGAVLPLMDTEEPLVIEDLDASDRKQLSDSITTWFQKNRGNMNISDLVSVEIQRKLDHWQYSIELWTQSDGVDSIELAQNTMRASVISLTKPDRQGFAYCYKKPNALSTVWVNKGWYKVQRTNSTLEVSSEPLEIN
ncbi:hypothetical protein [Psychrobacter sp. DAB_AL62B]|uniref:hypothetical protein n=1 Tax=Psychrobacter sp. DAB_AL62B TaxID=1028420 RepID=UPI0023810B4A|nr:hypothetical protein [Psychrobacter sp. DAB_AL62B]MDE4456164.1 hypothetical protein [Psychrobacter sp. DAB_AL62B]